MKCISRFALLALLLAPYVAVRAADSKPAVAPVAAENEARPQTVGKGPQPAKDFNEMTPEEKKAEKNAPANRWLQSGWKTASPTNHTSFPADSSSALP